METLTSQKKTRQPARSRVRKPKTLEAFLRWEQPEGYYKYESVRAQVPWRETEYMMKTNELAIVRNIKKAFATQPTSSRQQGELFAQSSRQTQRRARENT